jgi:hypothetical protein
MEMIFCPSDDLNMNEIKSSKSFLPIIIMDGFLQIKLVGIFWVEGISLYLM